MGSTNAGSEDLSGRSVYEASHDMVHKRVDWSPSAGSCLYVRVFSGVAVVCVRSWYYNDPVGSSREHVSLPPLGGVESKDRGEIDSSGRKILSI